MLVFRFKNVCIEAFAVHFPTIEVTSAEIEDRLAPLYERLQIPFGTLEKLSGIKSRGYWDAKILPSEVATVAAREAIERSGLPASELGAIFSCSVSRDYFEPATACIIHRNLELSEETMAYDISNACIGFSNGVLSLANLIESGVTKSGVVVSGENISRLTDNNIKHLQQNTSITRDELLQLLPTFTLGSGAVAFVLTHSSIAKTKHKIIGSVTRSATQFKDLCAGNADHCISGDQNVSALMRTESAKLMASAAKLGSRMWKDFSSAFDWTREGINHIFCHQVGKQVNDAFYQEMGLDLAKEYTIYKKYGNLVSAALPAAFVCGVEEKERKGELAQGHKILLTAFGSGLNSIFTGIEW